MKKLKLLYWKIVRWNCLNQMKLPHGHEYVIDYYNAVNQIEFLKNK